MINKWPIISRLFGGTCVLCRQPGESVCTSCADALPINDHSCRCCALPLPDDAPAQSLCADCLTHPAAFDRIIAPLRYTTPVDDLVSAFKYHHGLPLGRMLSALLADAVDRKKSRIDLLLPVPAGAARLRERGFNQATEIAQALSRRLAIPWSASHLLRAGSTGQQRVLSRHGRRRNVRGMFSCEGDLPARIAIIDDVVTTGATADEAAHTLKRCGVEHVEVWAIARTPRAQ